MCSFIVYCSLFYAQALDRTVCLHEFNNFIIYTYNFILDQCVLLIFAQLKSLYIFLD